MNIRIELLLIGLFIGQILNGQTNIDTVYCSTRLVPRFGINIQKGYGIECGLFLNKFYTGFPNYYVNFLPYVSSGVYISSELILRDFDNFIIGPKIGLELSEIGETQRGYFGFELINYTDFKNYSPSLMLKTGVPLFWMNVGYGYTIFFENSLKNVIGKHRLTITYTINRQAKNKYKQLLDNLNNRHKNE